MLTVIVAAGLLCATFHNSLASQSPWYAAAYLSGQPDLQDAVTRYWQHLTAAAESGAIDGTVQIDGAHMAARWRLSDGLYQPLGITDMAAPENLTAFLQWADISDRNRSILILAGHGTGVATVEHQRCGVISDGGSEATLTAAQAARAVEEAQVTVDILSLDSCHGATLEAIWELRGIGSYCVAVPARLPHPGLPWAEVLSHSQDDSAVPVIRRMQATYGSPLAGVECGQLTNVADRLEKLVTALRGDMQSNAPALRLVRSRTTSWGYRDETCDLLELASDLQTNAGTVEAEKAAAKLVTAIQSALVTEIGHSTGRPVGNIGIFFPPGWERPPEWYEAEYDLAKRTGWASFLAEYYEMVKQDLIGNVADATDVSDES